MRKKLEQIMDAMSRSPDRMVFLVFFLYALIVGLLIQLVLLPYIFPQWHAGDGMIKGLDSFQFHMTATLQAQKISDQGWQAWVLAPFGQPVAGIASLLYVWFTPHPWVVLPLNALLHALAVFTLFKILLFLLEKRGQALLACLPILLFPSALSWVAQMHNDNYAVAGNLLILYGLVCFSREKTWQNWKTIVMSCLTFVAGVSLVWLVRAYAVKIIAVVGGLIIGFLLVLFFYRLVRKIWDWKKTLLAAGVILVVFLLAVSFAQTALPKTHMSREDLEQVKLWDQNQDNLKEVKSGKVQPDPNASKTKQHAEWTSTSSLPKWLETQMRELSKTRDGAIKQWETNAKRERGSNIDVDVSLHSALDIIRYLPRAVEISYLAPFPADWFGKGSKSPNTMMRRFSGLEMIFSYFCWFGLFYAWWLWRKRPEVWILLFYCTAMMIILVMGTPNVGTIYRFRYPFIMPLVGLGLTGWIMFFQKPAGLSKQRIAKSSE